MDANPRYAIGIDVGGTHTKVALVSQSGEVAAFERFLTNAMATSEPFQQQLLPTVQKLLAESQPRVLGIGVSVHGWVDNGGRGPVMCPNTPALNGFDLKGLLEGHFHLPVKIYNDLTAHTLAEYAFGVGQGAQRFLCLAIGTGLGAGVIIDGRPLNYLGGGAGDTGHIILEPGGPPCSAGCRGCAEALCGVEGIERLARQKLGRSLAAYEVISRAREGDPEAGAVIDQVGEWLGQTLASLCSIYLPDRVALSGGISEAGPVLLDACKHRFEQLVGDYHRTVMEMFFENYHGVEIVLGKMRGQSGAVGAVVELLREASLSS